MFRLNPIYPRSAPTFQGGDRTVPLTLRAMSNARTLRLTVDPVRETVLLTMPSCGSRRAALAWAEARRTWIEALLADAPAALPFVPGVALPFDDATLTLAHDPDARSIAVRQGDRLVCGGPADRFGARVESWVRRQGRVLLSADTADFAGRAGVTVSRVSVGDPRRRWGSCSSGAAIAYSWRLALAPRFVRRSVAAHEVAHRLHMDHSPAFHAAHARLLGEDPAPAKDWLRRHGAELHLFGRGGGLG